MVSLHSPINTEHVIEQDERTVFQVFCMTRPGIEPTLRALVKRAQPKPGSNATFQRYSSWQIVAALIVCCVMLHALVESWLLGKPSRFGEPTGKKL